jgi:hypothetical protein
MRIAFIASTIFILICIAGCDGSSGPLSSELVEKLAGNWTGVLDYTISGGVTTPMTLTMTEEKTNWLSALMTTGTATYQDNYVAEVNGTIVMNFVVAGETWELVLEGELTDSTLEGDIIQREAGKDDIIIGNWVATPS